MTELLSVANLRTGFHTHGGVIRAVDGVDFTIEKGGTLGVVGESGSGKSVTALSIMRLIDLPGRVESSSSILFEGSDHFLQLVIGDSWSTPGISSLRWTGRRGLGAAFIRSSRPLPPSPAVTPTPSASSVTAD